LVSPESAFLRDLRVLELKQGEGKKFERKRDNLFEFFLFSFSNERMF
jgi:hypothetical protein